MGQTPISAQMPSTYTVRSIEVEGVTNPRTRDFVIQSSGLSEGQKITLPGSEALGSAVRAIYNLRLFSDVEILRTKQGGGAVDLLIKVTPEPRLATYSFEGIGGGDREDIDKKVPLLKGRPVRPADIERTIQVIKQHYRSKGFRRAEVDVEREVNDQNRLNLTFDVDRGKKVEVQEINISGNENIADFWLRRRMKETKAHRWWRFWKGETFDRSLFEEDVQRIEDLYKQKGYYDARVVKDSVYYSSEYGLTVDLKVHEGQKYYVRDVEWDGNTVYPDQVLTNTLGFEEGDVYDGKKLEQNLRGSPQGNDVSSLYMDRGYMRFQVQPQVRVVGQDSLDLTFDIQEGDTYDFGDIQITGNQKTKEHVIRRELYTLPGERFSRSAIQESVRRLLQLNYFSQESLKGGPNISVDQEEQEVDLTYSVEEVGSDQLELSGTWGRYGLVLQLGFTFNNFSAQNLFNWSEWQPLPSGDGQKLSLNVRTNGRYYQNYSASFTEPWFLGRPNPVGGSVSYSRFSRLPSAGLFGGARGSRLANGAFSQSSAQLFYERRLQWPDDKFSLSNALGYQFYQNSNDFISSLPEGVSQQLTLTETLSRNSLNNPIFPTSGSKVSLSLELAPPVSDFVQYHKWRLKTSWNVPLGGRFSLNFKTDYGYIGSITGEEVQFQRFDLGGSAFDYGGYNYGTEPVFMRGYPARVLGPRRTVTRSDGTQDVVPVGGTVLNKYTSELRFQAIESQQLRAAPYLFLDAANSWDSFQTYNPAQLYRSAGVGVRVFLPIVGLIEFNYGYNFDRYTPIEQGDGGDPGWTFQFSIGGAGGGRR
jgi:outer membrane protein insertion porin family